MSSAAQAFQAHEPCDAVFPRARISQRLVHSRRAVHAAACSMNEPDTLHQGRVGLLTIARWSSQPGVEAALGDLEDSAHGAYPEGLPVVLDEAKLHFCSSAK